MLLFLKKAGYFLSVFLPVIDFFRGVRKGYIDAATAARKAEEIKNLLDFQIANQRMIDGVSDDDLKGF